MLACAIGKFDALHRGHQALIARARALGEPAILMFSGMAGELGWEERLPLLAEGDAAALLREWGVRVLTLPFATIRPLTPAAFLAHLRTLDIGAVVVGEDFRFGRDRVGTAAALPALAHEAGLSAAVVPAVSDARGVISSSRIRADLAAGEMTAVAAALGRPYRLRARVVRGDGRGRTIGVPTCNCGEHANQPPGGGVYAAWARLDDGEPIMAAVNAGHVPTAGGGRPFTVEAHLLDWSGDAYGHAITLDFIARLRDERRFDGLDALRAQIDRDVAATRVALTPAVG